MQHAMYSSWQQPQSTTDLLDRAFWVYRRHIRLFVSEHILLLALLLEWGAVYLTMPLRYPAIQFAYLAAGLQPTTFDELGKALYWAIFRELCFADGVIWWSLMAVRCVPMMIVGDGAYLYSTSNRPWAHGRLGLLVCLLAVPVLGLRMLGLGPVADLTRLPTLCVVCVLAAEQTSVRGVFARSWMFFRHDWQRIGALFVLVLFLLGLVVIVLLVTPTLLIHWLPLYSGGVVAYYPKILAFGALLGQFLVAPIAQIAVTLLYRDLRVRREGINILAALSDRVSWPGVSSSVADTTHVLKMVHG
jgi:hypothetical protein